MEDIGISPDYRSGVADFEECECCGNMVPFTDYCDGCGRMLGPGCFLLHDCEGDYAENLSGSIGYDLKPT